jgi:hypothetical protein
MDHTSALRLPRFAQDAGERSKVGRRKRCYHLALTLCHHIVQQKSDIVVAFCMVNSLCVDQDYHTRSCAQHHSGLVACLSRELTDREHC